MRFVTKTFVRMQISVSVSFCLLLVKRKLLKAQNVLLRRDQANKPTHTYVRSAQMFNFSILFCRSLWSPYRNTHTQTTYQPPPTQKQHAHIFLTTSLMHLSTNLVVSLLPVCECLKQCGCTVSRKGMFCLSS